LAWLVAAAFAGIAVLSTSAVAGWHFVIGADPEKAVLDDRVTPTSHVGPRVASDGGWSLYARSRPGGLVDVELSSRALTSLTVLTGEWPIESVLVSGSAGVVLGGRVTEPGVTRLALQLPDGTSVGLPFSPAGYFIRVLGVSATATAVAEGSLVAYGADGRALARSAVVAD
jgi:hypothetical protein